MSIKDGRDYLLLVWKEPKTRRCYTIGELSKNGQFEFSYGYEVGKAIEAGFELLIAFPDIEKVYKNEKLFSVFSSRLPDPKRKGIDAILEKYGLSEYDHYNLLKKSGRIGGKSSAGYGKMKLECEELKENGIIYVKFIEENKEEIKSFIQYLESVLN